MEEDSFAAFFEESWDPCVRAVIASTADPGLAEEQVAEAFARAWASWGRLRHHPAPRAWVVRTALNLGVSRWRKARRELPLRGHPAAPEAQPSGIEAPLLGALRRLPTRQREVVVLRVILDLDVETTARLLQMAPGTVRAHLARAMKVLRSEMTKAHDSEEDRCSKVIS